MRNRGSIAVAITLIGIGAWFMAIQFSPALKAIAYGPSTWPLTIIGIGAFLALVGLLTWSPGMFIPACIVAGVGGLLYYQNSTGDWASWAYAWALIPGFAGLGSIVAGLLKGNSSRQVREGMTMIVVSAILFVIFGSFLGGLDLLGPYWPVLLILAGLWVLVSGILRRRKQV